MINEQNDLNKEEIDFLNEVSFNESIEDCNQDDNLVLESLKNIDLL